MEVLSKAKIEDLLSNLEDKASLIVIGDPSELGGFWFKVSNRSWFGRNINFTKEITRSISKSKILYTTN